MWDYQDRKFVQSAVFERYVEMLGTNLSYIDVANIKVNISKDPEGYEKLRKTIIEFFSIPSNYSVYQNDAGFKGLVESEAVVNLAENFVRVANNIGGNSLDIQGSPSKIIVTELTHYEKCYDLKDLGELSKLKRISNGGTIFTVREIFDFMHLEFKTWALINYSTDSENYRGIARGIMHLYNYGDYDFKSDKTLLRKLFKGWEDLSYDEIKNRIIDYTSSGKASRSQLRSMFNSFEMLAYWVTDSKRVFPVAAEAFMSVLQAEMKNY